jgi:hypothetical protein
MRQLIAVMLIVVGIIHALPIAGLLGRQQLSQLYGLGFDEPNLEILMRHRALLFGLLGLFFLIAAFKPSLHVAAFVVGLISAGSFIWLAWAVGSYNAQLWRVVLADIVAVACLLVAIFAHLVGQRMA